MGTIKRTVAFLAAFGLAAGALSAQWRADVAAVFAKGRTYKAVADLIQPIYDGLNADDKADASALLAYCAGRQGDPANETRWIFEYFEKGRGKDSNFVFLDFISQADVIGYLNVWRMRYPFVSEIALIQGIGNVPILPQGVMPIVVDISSEAYYKFSLAGNVLMAGQFKPGFNVLGLDAAELFLNPGSRTYLLELKTGNLVLKKEIDLDIAVTDPPRVVRPSAAPAAGKTLEYTVALYIGGELVLSSRRTEAPINWKSGVPTNTLTWGWNPNALPGTDKAHPLNNSVNIIEAISYVYDLLKDLFTKKSKPDAPAPQIQTVQDLSVTIPVKDAEGFSREMKAVLRLKSRNLPYVLDAP